MKRLFPELVILMTSIIFSGSSGVIIEPMTAPGAFRPRVLLPRVTIGGLCPLTLGISFQTR